MLADEPSDDCPIHGGAPENRCECGRFVRVRYERPSLADAYASRGASDGSRMMAKPKTPKVLDAMADVVLRYRPKPKSEPAKQRRKKRRKLEKEK